MSDEVPQHQWINDLVDQSRIMGARMLRDDQPLTDDIRQAIVDRFQSLLKSTNVSASRAAASMGLKPSTLSQVLSGSYKGDVESYIRKIDRWIEQQHLKEAGPKKKLIRTGVVQRIYAVAKLAVASNSDFIGLIHGPSGIGKSETLKVIREEFPGTVYLSITSAGHTKRGVLDALAAQCRLPRVASQSDALFESLVNHLNGTGRLIIIDEIHKLVGRHKDEALHVLRDLHDHTHCPMLWSGMSTIANYIREGRSKGYDPLDQVASRIKYWLNFTEVIDDFDAGPGLYTPDHIREFLNGFKLRFTGDAIEYLSDMANTRGEGHLRALDALCGLIFGALKDKEETITRDRLRSTLCEVQGRDYIKGVEAKIELRKRAMA